ncbi:MAG: uroporphyrinogen decarboxylase family protein [Sedimentisphaerales bacterium]
MTPRERWQAVLNRRPVDRVPCDIWATPEVVDKLCKHLDCKDSWAMVDKLGIDLPYNLDPRYVGPVLAEGSDYWGINYKKVDYGTGIYSEATSYPLAHAETVADFNNHPWPKADWFDYSALKEESKRNSHRPIRTGWIEPFLFYSSLRGSEQAMIDMIVSPAMVECAFDHIFDFGCKRLERILEATGSIDLIMPSEDLGSQQGPLFSLECFRRFHAPRFKKYISLGKQAGAKVFFHTDGACRIFIPELINLGVDILNPIQHRCPGMERTALKNDFGCSLVFHGGVENQHILPFGTVDEVRQEVIDCFEMLAIGGGYICAPCHNIQPVTPIENILAMYDTIKELSTDLKYTRPIS